MLRASPIRLKDLALLQAYARDAGPCPLDEVRSLIAATPEGSEASRRLLRDTYKACKNWPPRLGSDEGHAIFSTEDGFRYWIAIVLGPDNPGIEHHIDELAETMTVGQYQTLLRIAYGSAPLDELSRIITPDSFPEKPDDFTNWGKVIRNLIVETGWTFEECGEVRMTQLAAFQSNGEVGTGKVDPPPGMSRFAFSRRQRQFFGPDREEANGDGDRL
jgi:hypothetical protein